MTVKLSRHALNNGTTCLSLEIGVSGAVKKMMASENLSRGAKYHIQNYVSNRSCPKGGDEENEMIRKKCPNDIYGIRITVVSQRETCAID